MILLCIPSVQVYGAEKSLLISKVHTSSKVIALTFDDGYSGERLKEILQILNNNYIEATFFLTGSAIKAHPKIVKSIIKYGNVIGNHSYSHPYFTKLTPAQMKKEISKTDAIFNKITGLSTIPYFRPPYGIYNSSVLKTVGAAGYTYTIFWTIDTLDWTGLSAKDITKKVLNKASPGSIVLMHAGGGAVNTPAALPDIIKGLKNMGYDFVTIPELLDYIQSDENIYIVQPGDTLSKISKKYGITVQEIATANNIMNPNLIHDGEVLTIPKN